MINCRRLRMRIYKCPKCGELTDSRVDVIFPNENNIDHKGNPRWDKYQLGHDCSNCHYAEEIDINGPELQDDYVPPLLQNEN